jgi:hypothetical protein
MDYIGKSNHQTEKEEEEDRKVEENHLGIG